MGKYEKAQEYFKRMWGVLAEDGTLTKRTAFLMAFDKEIKEGDTALVDLAFKEDLCFACVASATCASCPIDWWGHPHCTSYGSPFAVWQNMKSPELKSHWASIIRDLPWNDNKLIDKIMEVSKEKDRLEHQLLCICTTLTQFTDHECDDRCPVYKITQRPKPKCLCKTDGAKMANMIIKHQEEKELKALTEKLTTTAVLI